MIHVWHAFAFMLPEGRAAIDEAGAFLKAHLSGAAARDPVSGARTSTGHPE